eukprot:TRINITY_DN7850_c0_g2_i1.p1 TRINITY_DN7850_c0_g2~~TRINITY_DN7850_c0_g2_i1.p1  ORF type:complete len:393 (+),score=65.76 TRINITY_DN7850_c0_g2_i1:346-1524(+)
MAQCTKRAAYASRKLLINGVLPLSSRWKQPLMDYFLPHSYHTSAVPLPSSFSLPSRSRLSSLSSDATAGPPRPSTQKAGIPALSLPHFPRALNLSPFLHCSASGMRTFSDAPQSSADAGTEQFIEGGPPLPSPTEPPSDSVSEGVPVQRPAGSASSRQQASSGSQGAPRAAIKHHQMGGPGTAMRVTLPPELVGKVVGRVVNAPRYVLKSELVAFFQGSGLREEDVSSVVDERLKMLSWRLVFPSEAEYKRARQCVLQKRRIGCRAVRLDQVPLHELRRESDPRHPNHVADGFRGTSLIMTGAPDDASSELIERFFEGYNLAPYALRHIKVYHENVRTPLRMRLEGEWRPTIDLVERRTLVKFQTKSDCLRALRELHKEFLGDRPVELRLLQ